MKYPLQTIQLKKYLLLVFLTLVVSISANAQTNTIDSLKSVSQKEHKKILLYFSGSDWCGPCIKFKKNFIEQPEFVEFSTESLLLLNADFPRKKANQLSKEAIKENEMLAEKYNPKGLFPYVLLLDEEGNVIKKWESLPKESLTEFIENLKD